LEIEVHEKSVGSSGGVKIPEAVKTATRDRILKYAEQHYAGKYIRIDVRFRT
jgi:hypothetical protein